MSGEDDFRIRPGRIRSSGAQRTRPFISQALAAAQKAADETLKPYNAETSLKLP